MRARVGLWLGIAVAAALSVAPAPAGLSDPAWSTAAVAGLMAVWWVTEAIPIPATALLPLVLLPVLGIAPIDAAAAPYANPVIFLFLGGFILAAGLERSELHRRIALLVVRAFGTAPARLVAGVMVATALLSMWVSNTATAIMMLPIAASVVGRPAAGTGRTPASGGAQEPRIADASPGSRHGGPAPDASPDRAHPAFATALFLGVAYGANIGGLGTLIGTPPNALLAGFADEAYGIRIGFGEWMLVGVPLVVVSLPIAWLLLTRVLFRLPAGAALAPTMERPPASRAQYVAGAVALLAGIAWVTRPLLERAVPGLSDAGIAMLAALLLFLLPAHPDGRPVVDWDDVERLPWGVLVLFGGGLSLAAAVQDTGLASWIGESMGAIAGWPLALTVAAVTAVVILLTELTSNTATAAAFLPVVAALAVGIGYAPLTLAVPAALAASCAFMLPVATPPNAVVYGSGRVTVPQMARAGLALNVLFTALITLVALTVAVRVLGQP